MTYVRFGPLGRRKESSTWRVTVKKLTLNLETLDVQSFEPVDAPRQAGGTVFGAEPTYTQPECCYTFGCGDSVRQAC